MGNSTEYHEPYDQLPAAAREIHRAIASLIEEFEAVDWYNQRASVTGDEALARILLHNRDEEIEHAAMALEWLRRRIPKLDEELRTYLFTEGDIAGLESDEDGGEEAEETAPSDPQSSATGLGLGSLASSDDERTE